MRLFLMYLGFLSLFGFNSYASGNYDLYIISNQDNVGDHNQAKGIAKAMEEISPPFIVEDLNIRAVSPCEIKDKIEKSLVNRKVIVIGAGEGGLLGIQDLTPNPNLIIALTSHMFLKGYKNQEIKKTVSYIALPSHASDPLKTELGEKLIETIGVAHNRQAEVADKTYKEWGKELPQCTNYLGVILGGDAPTPEKVIKLFTEEDAINLANYVTKIAKSDCVLILNGPRTGKHNSNGNENQSVHRNGYSDPITLLFKKTLEENGIKSFKVFDFQHNTEDNKGHLSPYNAFDLVVGALRAKGGTLLVPGESTTSISEAIDTMPAGKVLVYLNSAMNEVHKGHVASELQASRVSVLENYEEVRLPSANSNNIVPSAAKTIAQALLKTINLK